MIETRKITQTEAQECAKEQVQYIGTVQPHGFLLVINKKTHEIVQCSKNFLTILNQDTKKPFLKNKTIINTPLSQWMNYNSYTIFDELMPKSTILLKFNEGGYIEKEQWECFGSITGEYISLEFLPNRKTKTVYKILSSLDRMTSKIRETSTPQELFDTITKEFQKHTQYDRVMLYKFHPDWSGEVLSEAVSNHTRGQFLGMRFPSEDIPKAARDLYKTSSLRVMADVDAEMVELTPELLPTGKKLDQSQSILRGMSLMHIKYLKNMGVKASLSIALISNNKLWGLMAFHHYKPMLPPNHLVSEMKASCELFAEIIISYLNPALELDRVKNIMKGKQIIEKMFGQIDILKNENTEVQMALDSIREVLDKDYIGLFVNNKCFISARNGKWSPSQNLKKNIERLLQTSDNLFFSSNKLLEPDKRLILDPNIHIAGIISKKSNKKLDLIVFFAAPEVEKEIKWGGKPHTVDIKINNGRRQLEPRSSFALWRQKVIGQSSEWTDDDKELLGILLASAEEHFLYKESEEIKLKLYQSSYNDPLTGLPNRRYLKEYVQSLAAISDENKNITVLFIDLDDFKKINDYYGHQTGDKLLIEVSSRLSNCIRPHDFAVRLGGDEFIILIEHETADPIRNKITTREISSRIINSLSKPIMEGKNQLITTPSIGALSCSYSQINYADIMQRADTAMYKAKKHGKNRVHYFNIQDQKEVIEKGIIEAKLRSAIKNNDIEIYFQPQTNVMSEVIGAEALARWHDPDLGLISPDVFISLAEKNNLIYELGLQLYEKACITLSKWKKNKNDNTFEKLSINVSPIQFSNSHFEKDLLSINHKHNIKYEEICLEITESIFMENFDLTVSVLNRLKKLGFHISLDDFGTGYSSLSYLLKLPVNEVKIDKSFVLSLTENTESLTMVEGIISLCKQMNLKIVAEGIEEKIHFMLLKSLGCDCFQGYYFGHPVEEKHFQF